MPKPSNEFQVPKDLHLCSDLLYQTRQSRLELQKQVDELASRESQLKTHLIAEFQRTGSTSIGGKIAKAELVEKEEPTVLDWEALWKYVAKTKSWDILQKRISAPAVKARWEAKKAVAGVDRVTVFSISNTKI